MVLEEVQNLHSSVFGLTALKNLSPKEKGKLDKIVTHNEKQLEKQTIGDSKSRFYDDQHEKTKIALLQIYNLKSVYEEFSKPRAERYAFWDISFKILVSLYIIIQ